MRFVHVQQPGASTAKLRAQEYLPPPYSRVGTPPLVSGKWIPAKPVLITAVVVTATTISGSCRFGLIVGANDTVMPSPPTLVDLFLMGGTLQNWVTTSSVHTRVPLNLLINPTDWLAIAEFDANPCTNPVIMFEGGVQS